MKPALNQQATRTTNGTQNWTDASINSDQKLQLFFGTEALANDTTTGAAKLFLGATDLTNNIAFTAGTIDATPPASAISHTLCSSTKCLVRTTSAGAENLAAAISATLSNGITINQTTSDAGAYLFNGLSLAGADHVAPVSSTSFATTDLSKVVTHGAGGTPDAVMIFVSFGSATADNGNAPQKGIVAIWDGTNSASFSIKCSTSVSPTDLAARMNSAVGGGEMGHQIDQNDTDVATFSIGSIGSTTFTLTRTATGSTAAFVTCISFRHTSGTWAFKCGVTTLPTATGIAALVTGMAVQPQVLMTFASRLTSTALAANSDAAGSSSFGVACNNNGVTQQMVCAMTEKNGISTGGTNSTVSKCMTSASAALLSLDNTGAVVNKATAIWNSDGASLNHSAVGASAFQMMYFAFGAAVVIPGTGSESIAGVAPSVVGATATMVVPLTA